MNRLDLEKLADDVLGILRCPEGGSVDAEKLAGKLRVDVRAIDSALGQLRKWRYKIKRSSNGELTFLEAPDSLTATEITYQLPTRFIGRVVHAYEAVKSTNDPAAQLVPSATEGTIVVAERQTRGRGRFSRTWFSPAGAGIYLSIILKPSFGPEQAPGISVMTALALAKALESYCPGKVRIKWPNDVQLSGRKVAGILTELSAERDRIDYLIVGVGINVNQRAVDFPDDIKRTATSLRRELRRRVRRVELLKEFLVCFEKEYIRYRKSRLRNAQRHLRAYSSLIGRTVALASGRSTIEGVAVDIDPDGHLVLEINGKAHLISAGEVTVISR